MLLANTCCSALASILGRKVLNAGSSAYNQTELAYWSTQEASISPSCIVKPTTTEDVASFISVAANNTNCQFAIKARGHAPGSGFANIDGGVTLDMTSLNATTISSDHTVASVGTGSSWVDVYRALNPYNKTVAGGRNGAVGVGGLTLGGGISYYSPQVGWTCDTVVNFEVVLASSEIVNANATFNADLYRALKGGGNNFGVVTKIDFQAIDTVPLLAGHVFNSPNYTYEVLNAFNNIASALDYDVHTSIVTSLTFNSTTKSWSVVNVPTYTLPDTAPIVYSELFAIPNITSLTSMSLQNISSLAAEPPYPQKFELFYTSTYAAIPQSDLLRNLFDACNATLQAEDFAADISWSLAFEPLPISFWNSSANSNVLGFDQSSNTTTGSSIILLISVSWTNSTLSESAHTFGTALLSRLDEVAAQMGMLKDFKYLNYADATQRPFKSYGQVEQTFLGNVSAKYDPNRVFQQKVPGGFKLV